jgi:uncharacterized protein (TIGR03083 family)
MQRPIKDVLKEETDAVFAMASGLSEPDFSIPTRCEPWDIKALLAHMWRDLYRIPEVLDKPPPSEPNNDAVRYWRSYDPEADAPRIAEHALETAQTYRTGAELTRSFADISATCYGLAGKHAPDRLIEVWWGPRMRLDEFLKTRVLELVVHGIDMTDALCREHIATNEGLSITTTILDALLEDTPPRSLGWTPPDYIRKGTGRQPLSSSDRHSLGPVAERFPLLG